MGLFAPQPLAFALSQLSGSSPLVLCLCVCVCVLISVCFRDGEEKEEERG